MLVADVMLVAERIDRPPLALFGEEVEGRGGVGGEPTLDDAIVGAWEGLAAQVAVGCPLCEEGTLRLLGATAASPAGGRCDRCHATLV
jgi:hypothetical protein